MNKSLTDEDCLTILPAVPHKERANRSHNADRREIFRSGSHLHFRFVFIRTQKSPRFLSVFCSYCESNSCWVCIEFSQVTSLLLLLDSHDAAEKTTASWEFFFGAVPGCTNFQPSAWLKASGPKSEQFTSAGRILQGPLGLEMRFAFEPPSRS